MYIRDGKLVNVLGKFSVQNGSAVKIDKQTNLKRKTRVIYLLTSS